MISKKQIVFFLLVCNITFGKVNVLPKELEENIDEAYIEVKCKELKDDFFMVRYDFEKDIVYVGLKSFLYFLEISTLNVDLETGMVSGYIEGKKIDVQLEKEDGYKIEDDIFVTKETLIKKFNFNEAIWNSEELKLELDSNFELPYEIREKKELLRLRMENENKNKNYKVVRDKKRMIAPGIIKLNYYQQDIEDKEYSFGIEYGTQFLKGDLYLNQRIKPKNELINYSLTYNDIYKENSLILGDFYFKSPNFLNVNTAVEGVSFGEENTYSKKNLNTTVIEGEAQGADIIELYQNDILIDYQKPTSRRFEFVLKDSNYNGEYTLKIYYKNGQVEERKVYTLNDLKLLSKGKSEYNLQLGINRDTNNQQKMLEYRYGINDNLTLGIAFFDLYSDEKINYQMLRNDIVYRYSFRENPMVISLNNYYDLKKSNFIQEGKIEQKIKSYKLKAEYKKYSDMISEMQNEKEYLTLGIEKEFLNHRVSVGGFNEKKFDINSITGYYLSYENRKLKNWSFVMDTQFAFQDIGKKIQIGPTVSYNGFENMNLLLRINYLESEEEKNVEYSFKVLGRKNKSEILKGEYNYSLIANYTEEDKFSLGVEFTYYFDNYIYLETPITTENNRVQMGVALEKSIDVSNVKRKIKDREVENSWVYGKIFIDSNNNGKLDKGEKGLENVGIEVDGRKTESDIDGNYLIEGLISQEEYQVLVDRKSIDPMLVQVNTKELIKPNASVGMNYNIPMQAVSMVAGYIVPKGDISDSEFVRYMSMVNISLEKNGEKLKETEPEFDGMYYFEDVLPGKYKIVFTYLGDEKIEFSKEKLDLEVVLEIEDEGEYFEGNDIEIREVISQKEKLEKEKKDEMEEILTNY